MESKPLLDLANRLNEIEKERQKLDLEYNRIIYELRRRNPKFKDDVNLQLRENLSILIDEMLEGTYQDDLGEYTRAYPIRNCCRERLNIVKKRVRKYEDNRFIK
jgi:hypothetical protein